MITIQVNVPICPDCGRRLMHNQLSESYTCHCGSQFKVIGEGQTERELYCEREGTEE